MRPEVKYIETIKDGGIVLTIENFGEWGILECQLDSLSHLDFPVWEEWCTNDWTSAARKMVAESIGAKNV